MPAQAASFIKPSRAREPANPPDLESGDAQGGTEARDHFLLMQSLSWPSSPGIRLLSGITQVQVLPGAPPSFGDVKGACPPVKRIVVVRVHAEGPLSSHHSTEHVRLVEEAVSKTVTPSQVSRVQVLGAPPFPPSRLIVQKQNGRLTSGRPGSVTLSGDHLYVIIPP